MAHTRKKKRTQGPGTTKNARAEGVAKPSNGERVPKSMVIRMGASNVGPKVSQLANDVRAVMEPHTASRLKERRGNKLRDFTTMAGPLGVSHLLLFSRSEAGNTGLRIAVTPRGPTFTFRVEKYSLCKDVTKSQKRAKTSSGGIEHLTPPLLVMNNFKPSSTTKPTSNGDSSDSSSIPPHLENLSVSIFQSLFPPITPQKTPLSSIRRILLLDRATPSKAEDLTSYILNFRHYAITSRPLVPHSRGIKRLRAAEKFASKAQFHTQPSRPTENGPDTRRKRTGGSLPNLGRLDDVADYLLDPSAAAGFTSGSETELDTDAEVEVVEQDARKVLNRKKQQHQRERQREAQAASGANSETVSTRKSVSKQRTQKRAVKLTELGPRMTLRLVKVEEGVCAGKVLWHQFVTKTEEEAREQDEAWERWNAEKAEKRRIQRERVEEKRAAAKKNGTKDEEVDGEDDEEFDDDEMDYLIDEDADVDGEEDEVLEENEDEVLDDAEDESSDAEDLDGH